MKQVTTLLFGVSCLVLGFLLISCDTDSGFPTLTQPPDPYTPHYPEPGNNASGQPLALTLSWECEDADWYHVYFGQSNPPPLKSVVDTNVYTIISLDENVTYYWQIAAIYEAAEDTNWSPVWKFTTADFTNQPGFRLLGHNIEAELPCFVNIMFEVTTLAGIGVDDLMTSDFEVLEDSEPVSPTESAMNIRKMNEIPYALKTVLLLDNSTSVETVLDSIKLAAQALVDNKLPQQEIAIYEFSEDPVLVQDFTADAGLLTAAITGIDVGFASTDLYGAVIEGASRWFDVYTLDEIVQGFLIILTDGRDTQGSHTLNEASAAIGNKLAYTVGLGDEIDPVVMAQLGTADFISVANIVDLVPEFETIQEEIATFANSFYWLSYMSPKREDHDHTLELYMPDNPYTGSDSRINGSFNSIDFYPAVAGIYINKSGIDPYGIDTLSINSGQTTTLTAESFLGDTWPEFEWESDNTLVAALAVYTSDPSKAYVTAVGAPGASTTVRVTDTANGYEKEVVVQINL